MKVLLFENEYRLLENAFKAVNIYFFSNNKLEFEVHSTSQSFKSYNDLDKYEYVFVDISLATKSEVDGYGVIRKILGVNPDKKIIIITGNSQIEKNLKEEDLPKFPIIKKPVSYKTIYTKIKEADNNFSKNKTDITT